MPVRALNTSLDYSALILDISELEGYDSSGVCDHVPSLPYDICVLIS